jgi:hydroxymethylglutaryl-CoA lyase
VTAKPPPPKQVAIRDVGPRDGLQNESAVAATADKIALIERLAAAGLRRIELTSFVRADVIPQLADAAEVLDGLSLPNDVSRSVLIPNRRGLENALERRDRFDEINVFVSATETHNQRNVRRPVEESLVDLELVISDAVNEGLRCEAVVVVAFECPYEGPVDSARVVEIAARLAAAGAKEVAFGDTIGKAHPLHVAELFMRAAGELPGVELTAHFHDTYGRALANASAALQCGCRSLESSVGGLGGSPLTPGATGNVCTEDLVSMLHSMGFETGVDLEALVDCAVWVGDRLGKGLPSKQVALRAAAAD